MDMGLLIVFDLLLCITLVSSSCLLYDSFYDGQKKDFTCQCVQTMDFSLDQAYSNQPLYYKFLPQCKECLAIDNICQTYSKLPDGKGYYKVYEVIVYQNGTSRTAFYIAKQKPTVGVSTFSSWFQIPKCRQFTVRWQMSGITQLVTCNHRPCLTFTSYLFALFNETFTIGYRCSDYGESSFAPFVFGVGLNREPLDKSSWKPIGDAIAAAGLPVGKYYTLPNCLPSQCVTREPCQRPGNPLYGLEASTCQELQEPELCA